MYNSFLCRKCVNLCNGPYVSLLPVFSPLDAPATPAAPIIVDQMISDNDWELIEKHLTGGSDSTSTNQVCLHPFITGRTVSHPLTFWARTGGGGVEMLELLSDTQ